MPFMMPHGPVMPIHVSVVQILNWKWLSFLATLLPSIFLKRE